MSDTVTKVNRALKGRLKCQN